MTPKINLLLFILCLATVARCKKKSFLSGPDKVDVHEFNPVPEITAVDSICYCFPGALGPTIYPSDLASRIYLLDIDGDSNPDFKLSANLWSKFVSNSSPSANYNYEMSISGIETTSQIAMTDKSLSNAILYSSGESINQTALWASAAWLQRTGGSTYGPNCDFSGTTYIGLRMKKKSRQHYCWLKITKVSYKQKLQIQSFGYNKSNGNDIAAGQGE
ncbi:hypothetical protein D3C71_1441750 [compost metagenome]